MEIVNIVLPVFLLIGLGYLLRIIRFLNDDTAASLVRFVFYVSAPALLFQSTLKTSLSRSLNGPSLLVIISITTLVAFITYLAAWRAEPRRRGVLAQGAHRSNMVFVGLPIIASAYGPEAMGPAAVTVGIMVIVYNFLAVLVLSLPRRNTSARDPRVWKSTVRQMVLNPLIIGCCLGMAGSLVTLKLPVSVDGALDLLGRVALPLALVSVGAGLDVAKLRGDLGAASLMSLIKLIVYPMLVYAGLRLIGQTGIDAQVSVLLVATPTAVVSYIMAHEMNGDEQLAGAVVIGSTLASLITMMGWLLFFRLD
jgi:malate permease and related proteins